MQNWLPRPYKITNSAKRLRKFAAILVSNAVTAPMRSIRQSLSIVARLTGQIAKVKPPQTLIDLPRRKSGWDGNVCAPRHDYVRFVL